MKKKLYFNETELTENIILYTRKWFYDNAMACIKEALSGKVFINNIENYVEYENKNALDFLEGINDNSFTFMQRAYYFQTGKSIALLQE